MSKQGIINEIKIYAYHCHRTEETVITTDNIIDIINKHMEGMVIVKKDQLEQVCDLASNSVRDGSEEAVVYLMLEAAKESK